MIQTRFGLAKVKNDHARQAKYKLVRHWYIQRDALGSPKKERMKENI
jgi:hypothetical protein